MKVPVMTTNEIKAPLDATRQELAELARSRARIYGTLGVICAGTTGEQLVELLQPWATLEKQPLHAEFPLKMRRGLKRIGKWLEEQVSQPSQIEDLSGEFTRLFRGLSRSHSPPPPYESVYLDGGLLYGPSTQQVAQRYRHFQLKGQNNEPPDYIALELDFMRFLSEREALAWETGNGAQDLLGEEDAFLREHLARWVPTFCENVRRFDTTVFYAGLADVTEGWICCDRRIVRGVMKSSCNLVSLEALPRHPQLIPHD